MGLFKDYVSQTRKPEGFLGKMMVNGMNGGHAKMADWGLSHLTFIVPERIVEIGCGGGRNAGELLKKYPASHVTAIDYSDVSVSKASAYNADAIKSGRCDETSLKFEKIIEGMKCHTIEEIEDALKTAGFSKVKWRK